ncbi:bifunctional adenosylcobinamide kinase/adenosylcobinamide-phosphate guanylyltransferase [Tessaracoccus coleopterorum]|uniref:bifunctional adenosylcobinamide kinase/adenosylcobinamide-phosphate guanylyltransferase n=1 Tax=Tessaracoccus coleopterorum TaxID=2714950 RepID=UPI001E3A1434|nr:bifunctional adenosylcobinamide kinase/adenosylcobinamide-phosphate guanylyltransferase [Tessaracoccus coleopterorum]
MEFRVRIDPGDGAAADLLARLAAHGEVTAMVHGRGTTLVLGGARSGKSSWAEAQLADRGDVEYVATSEARADDPEWLERVALHRARRPASWRTTETIDPAAVLGSDAPSPVLIDCLAVWLDRILLDSGAWDDREGWRDAVEARVAGLIAAIGATSREVILVSNEVGSGVVPATASGRLYRDELGRLNARVAAAVDELWLCTAGVARRLK